MKNVSNAPSLGITLHTLLPCATCPRFVQTSSASRGEKRDIVLGEGVCLPGRAGVAAAPGAAAGSVVVPFTAQLCPLVGESYCSCSMHWARSFNYLLTNKSALQSVWR